jgi:hypothetical protein
LKRTSTTTGYLFFIFDLEYLTRVQSSELLHAKSNLLLVWITVCMCSNREHPAIQTKIEQHFGGFFHQIKVCQPIGRQDSMQTVIETSRMLDSFLHEVTQNFDVFSNIQE